MFTIIRYSHPEMIGDETAVAEGDEGVVNLRWRQEGGGTGRRRGYHPQLATKGAVVEGGVVGKIHNWRQEGGD